MSNSSAREWLRRKSSVLALYLSRLSIPVRFRILLVPLRRLIAVRQPDNRQRRCAVDLGHIVVIDLLPLVAHAMIIGKQKRHTEGMRRNTGLGHRPVVAREE